MSSEDIYKGLSDEERERMLDLISRGELEPGPDLTERYVHPLTGEVIREGGPDTPEARELREEYNRLFDEMIRERYRKAQEDSGR